MTTLVLSLTLLGLSLNLVEQYPTIDRAGDYSYEVSYSRAGPGETPIAEFRLFDREQRLLAGLHKPGFEMVFVSPQGWFVGALNAGDRVTLTFCDRVGRTVATVESEAPANYAFAPAGNYLYVGTARDIRAYDAGGQVAARFSPGSWFRPSDDERLLATVNGRAVSVWAFGQTAPKAGFELNSLLFRDLAFSANGDYLAVAERSTVSLHALRRPGRVWQQELGPNAALLGLAVTDDGRVFAGGESARQGFLSLLADGQELTRAAVPYTDDRATIRAVRLTGTGVRVRTTDRDCLYAEAK